MRWKHDVILHKYRGLSYGQERQNNESNCWEIPYVFPDRDK